jgi:hypothetical protein
VGEKDMSDDGEDSVTPTPGSFDLQAIERENGGQKYKILTREYMAEGHDGYTAFKGKKYLIDDEGGNLMSTVVRKYFLGQNKAMHLFEFGFEK